MSDRESIDIDLGLVYRAVRRSWLLAIGAFTACVALAAFASTRLTPTYEADAKILFTKVDQRAALTGLDPQGTGQLQSLLIDQTPLSTEMQVLTSRPLLEETIERLDLRNDEGEPLTPESLSPGIDLSIIGGTDVLEILYTDPDPDIAAAIVNTLIDVYREYSITTNRAEAKEAKEFLLTQLPQTEENVRRADQALRDFLEQNNVGVLEEEASSLVTSREAIDNQISTIEADLEAAAARAETLQNRLQLNPEQAYTVGSLTQNPGVQDTLTALRTVEQELAIQRSRYSSESPVVRQLQTERDSLQQLLQRQLAETGGSSSSTSNTMIQSNPNQQSIMQTLIQDLLNTEAQYASLQEQLDVLQGYRDNYQSRLGGVPALRQIQRELERRVAIAETTYEALLTQLQALEVRENETSFNTRVIQPATVPEDPIGGDKVQILALGVMGGAFLAIAIIALSEVFRFRKAQQFALVSDNPKELLHSSDPDVAPSNSTRS